MRRFSVWSTPCFSESEMSTTCTKATSTEQDQVMTHQNMEHCFSCRRNWSVYHQATARS